MAQKMDDNRYRFPRYTIRDADLQSTPSYWPLSQMRSSVDERDMSPEGETFDRIWFKDSMSLLPYQEQTIKNLTGRPLQESLASIDNNLMRDYPDPPPGAPLGVRQCPEESRGTYPYYLYGEHYYRPVNAPGTSEVDAAMESEDSKPRQRKSSRTSELSDGVSSMVLDERDATLRHDTCASAKPIEGDEKIIIDKPPENANSPLAAKDLPTGHTSITTSQHRIIRHPPTPTSPKEAAPPCSVSHPSMSISNILNHDMRQIRTPEPSTVLQPSCQMVMDKQDEKGPSKEGVRRLPHRQSAPTSFHVEQPEDDDDPTDSFHETLNVSYVNVLAKPKAKQKLGEQGSHVCKICNITFTRNFDLQRHNQRHKEETDEDKARRTCTNCNRLLSRVDATKRHVDTLPDSCNHIRKKEGKMMLPPMPQSHYDTCKAMYYKLAQETKKPKGRKKAVAVP